MIREAFVHSFIRSVFLAVFVVLVLVGIFGGRNKKIYTPESVGTPVISVTVNAEDGESENGGDSVYTFGNTDGFPQCSASACAVLCADNRQALYLKNADTVLPMASTTKIMTALVAIEKLSPDTVVTAVPEACGIEGSSIYLTPGEKLTVRDLLYGLMLESGNDAACALALCAGGSISGFADMMNARAREMGLVYTHFDNPHGLSSENHHTTARELAIITYYAMKEPLFRSIVGTKSYTVTDGNGAPLKYFSNHNRLLRTYDGATGVKTGYTIASGRCLVTSASRDGSEFIVVTLNDRNDFADHASLLDYAFRNYRTLHIAQKGSLSFAANGVTLSNNDAVCLLTETADDGKTFEADVVLRRTDIQGNN